MPQWDSMNGLYGTNVSLPMSWPFPSYRHRLTYDGVVPAPPLLVAYTPTSAPEILSAETSMQPKRGGSSHSYSVASSVVLTCKWTIATAQYRCRCDSNELFCTGLFGKRSGESIMRLIDGVDM